MILKFSLHISKLIFSSDRSSVSEGAMHGTLVSVIEVVDKDVGRNTQTTFTVLSGNELGLFLFLVNLFSNYNSLAIQKTYDILILPHRQ